MCWSSSRLDIRKTELVLLWFKLMS
jgi:hypothetical protein